MKGKFFDDTYTDRDMQLFTVCLIIGVVAVIVAGIVRVFG